MLFLSLDGNKQFFMDLFIDLKITRSKNAFFAFSSLGEIPAGTKRLDLVINSPMLTQKGTSHFTTRTKDWHVIYCANIEN